MNENTLLQAISDLIDQKLEPITGTISTMNDRLNQMDVHLGKIDERLDKVEKRLDKVEKHLDKVEKHLDKVEERLDQIESTMATKDDLHKSENMILSEIDRVQEKTNRKFESLQFKVI
jgi:predicted  nucleic acid-binding Zn-ribbon protein